LVIKIDKKYKVFIKGKNYKVGVHPDLKVGYWIECPTIPGCNSQDNTIKEALEMIKDAIKGYWEIEVEEKVKGESVYQLARDRQNLLLKKCVDMGTKGK
jgi:predicted RNase H-like HicB family nuclease